VEKTMQAPVTAIVAWDNTFYDRLPALFPTSRLLFQPLLAKNAASTFSRSNPDIGPVSRPSERQAKIRYAPSSELLGKNHAGAGHRHRGLG
jgi:hypothetical protein